MNHKGVLTLRTSPTRCPCPSWFAPSCSSCPCLPPSSLLAFCYTVSAAVSGSRLQLPALSDKTPDTGSHTSAVVSPYVLLSRLQRVEGAAAAALVDDTHQFNFHFNHYHCKHLLALDLPDLAYHLTRRLIH